MEYHQTKATETQRKRTNASRNKTKMSTLSTHNSRSPSQSNKARERNRRYLSWESRNKSVEKKTHFVDAIILYIENPEDSIKNYWKQKTNSVKLQDTKINV